MPPENQHVPSVSGLRVLVSDIGNVSSGDVALGLAAARRLEAMGHEATFFDRVGAVERYREAGLRSEVVPMPVEGGFSGVGSARDLREAFERRSPAVYREMVRSLERHDVLLVGPGCRFTEGFDNPRNLLAAAVAQARGVPVLVLHQSVGPIDHPADRALVGEVFSGCRLVLARDERSLALLAELGVAAERLVRCRDPLFAEHHPPPPPVTYDLGLNLRCGFNGHVDLPSVELFLTEYRARRRGAKVLVYSTTFDPPPHVAARLRAAGCEVRDHMSPAHDLLRDPGSCAVNVSDSLHGVILGVLAGRPVIPCQTGFRTWKLQGLAPPDEPPLEVLGGFTGRAGAFEILERVATAERAPDRLLARQARLAAYGRLGAETGWSAVAAALASRRGVAAAAVAS